VLEKPLEAPLPSSPVAQIVQVFQFVTQIGKKEDVEQVMQYVARMKTEMQGLLANYVVSSSGDRIATWATNKRFGAALIELKQYI